jgi:MscS family membrane protein
MRHKQTARVVALSALALVLVQAVVLAAPQGIEGADRWVRGFLPAPLFRFGPKGLMWWQWLAFPVLAAIAWVIGKPLAAVTRAILHRAASRTATTWDDRLLERIAPAMTLLWAAAVFRLFMPWLALAETAQRFVHSLLAGAVVITIFWALWRSVDVFMQVLLERPWAADNASARSLFEVAGNFLKGAIAIGGVVSTIAAFGYPVATALAGLGIGGLALAFGAQKTIENLFGSVALATDQPCRVGDFVKIDDALGTIERIGTRSTRIRTLDRTVITIPNGRLADMRIETFAARDRIRFATVVGVVYATTDGQMRRILAGMEQVLRAHPMIWADTVVVRFAGFGESALQIEVMCWFRTTDFDEFRACRQEVLFGFMTVVLEAGSSFAFPTRTVHLVKATAGSPAD